MQLGRDEQDIRARGLRAQDFRETLTLRFQDGSHATFHGALVVHDLSGRQVVVFTEHCGYFSVVDHVRVTAEDGRVVLDTLGEDAPEEPEALIELLPYGQDGQVLGINGHVNGEPINRNFSSTIEHWLPEVLRRVGVRARVVRHSLREF
ncbi:hypothetical protein GCM10008955_17570 [Deinococcus malanensis]|uniref:Uncharacterized protein n=2 Tax=Deinococcus malanensis TaxID=1706855 RepID=A0ABQ2ET34_9DEIO|nr:hypothetical protein GCM10008955_17570 [Deinococcus malanensis]